MKLKIFFLFLITIVFPIELIANNFPDSNTNSDYTYVYKLGPKNAKQIYKKGLSVVNESYFNCLVDSFPENYIYDKDLPQGNYLFVSAHENKLVFEFRSYSNIELRIHNNYSDLVLTLIDSLGHYIDDAKVKMNGLNVSYNKELHAYQRTKTNKRGWLEVYYDGFTTYHYLGNKVKKGVRYRRFVYSVPIKYLYIPARLLVLLPYDLVKTIINQRAQGLLYYIYKPFKDIYLSIFRYGTYGWINQLEHTWNFKSNKNYSGYMVFSKPKYKPNDTVRFKAFITDKKGNPIHIKDLSVKISSAGRSIKVGDVHCDHKGAYASEFVLQDSLNLRLDRYCFVKLLSDEGATIMQKSFYYEDYLLKSIDYSMRIENREHLRGRTQYVYLKGTDANDLNVPDGRFNLYVLSCRQYNHIYKEQAFIPDTLFKCSQKLDQKGETIITIPDSVFPAVDLDYKIKTEFLTSDNERITKEKELKYFYDKKEIKLKVSKDSIRFSYQCLGSDRPKLVRIKSIGNNGALLNVDSIVLPYSMPVNKLIKRYVVETDSLIKFFYLKDYIPVLGLISDRGKNTVHLQVDNPGGISFYYFVFNNNSEFIKGYVNELDTIVRIGKTKGCSVAINYVWGGETYKDVYDIPLYKKQLKVEIQQPEVVYPGQKVDLTVNVKDYKNKPVKDVDVTAFGLTRKFKYEPEILQSYDKQQKERVMFADYVSEGDKYFGESSSTNLNYEIWNQRMHLDNIAYYRFRYPENGFVETYMSADDSITQFAPFVYSNGINNQVHFVYVDHDLRYCSIANNNTYSMLCDSGYHSVELRTNSYVIDLDSVYFKYGSKTLLSVDPLVTSLEVNLHKTTAKLTDSEKFLLRTRFLRFNLQNSYGVIYAEQNGIRYLLKDRDYFRYRYKNEKLTVGPFKRGMVNYVCEPYYKEDFEFEPSYEYLISPGKIKMKTSDHFWTYPELFDRNKESSYFDMVLSDSIIKSYSQNMEQKRIQNHRNYCNPKSTKNGNGLLEIEYVLNKKNTEIGTRLQNILVFKDDNPSFLRLYPAGGRKIQDVKPGGYRLFFMMNDSSYFQYKNILVKPFGVNLIRIMESDSLQKDSMSVDIINLINRNWSFQIKEESSLLSKSQAEKNIVSRYNNSAALDYSYSRTITGNVADENGLSLPGVSIMIKGTDIGTISDMDGNYELKVPENTDGLSFSFIGMKGVDIDLSYGNVVNVEMEEDKTELDDVVVVGYGIQKYSSLSGSVSTVNPSLQGKLAGVNLISGNKPNARIFIRGVSSVESSNPPLIIIDGVPVKGDLRDVDPGKIKDMIVLKNEDAVAVYGSKAANGVIIINTNTGKGLKGFVQENNVEVPVQRNNNGYSIRTNFSDEAFWQPLLVTDKNGVASFSSTMPDDITSWDTYALAQGPHKTAGQTTGVIKSFKPVIAQLMMPQFMTEGDSIGVIGKCVNYTADTLLVETSYSVDSLLPDKRTLKLEKINVDTLQLSVIDNDTLSVAYSLTRGNGYIDGEKRQIPVVPQGVKETIGDFYVLRSDTSLAVKIPDSCHNVTLTVDSQPLEIIRREMGHLRHYRHLCNEQASSKLISLLNEQKICALLGEDFNYKKDVNKLINKLENGINEDGLWGWWPYCSTECWITNEAIKALVKAQNLGYVVKMNSEVLKRMLVNHWSFCSDREKIYVLDNLSYMRDGVDYKSLLDDVNDSLFSTMDSLKFALVKHNFGLDVDVKKYVVNRKETLFGNYYWGQPSWSLYDNDVQETLAVYLLIKNDSVYRDWLPKIRNYFFEIRKFSGWRNTYESSMIIDNILPDLMSFSKQPTGTFEITLNGKHDIVKQYPYSIKLEANDKVLIKKRGRQVVFVNLGSDFYNKKPVSEDKYFKINTHFERNGEVLDSLIAGEKVDMRVDVNVLKKSGYLMLEIPIPSVCTYASKPAYCRNESYREYHKDKLCVYYKSLEQGVYHVNIELVPRFTGIAIVNPARMENMYFPVFFGHNKISQINIK